jgi:Cyclophilin type peptidyl-prolyl cis-trans isomerase/CLD
MINNVDNQEKRSDEVTMVGPRGSVLRVHCHHRCSSSSQATSHHLSVEMESVVLETSMGDIQLELYWNHAPKVCLTNSFSNLTATKLNPVIGRIQTCKNFAELTRRGYYNGVVFHRIIAVGPASES